MSGKFSTGRETNIQSIITDFFYNQQNHQEKARTFSELVLMDSEFDLTECIQVILNRHLIFCYKNLLPSPMENFLRDSAYSEHGLMQDAVCKMHNMLFKSTKK